MTEPSRTASFSMKGNTRHLLEKDAHAVRDLQAESDGSSVASFHDVQMQLSYSQNGDGDGDGDGDEDGETEENVKQPLVMRSLPMAKSPSSWSNPDSRANQKGCEPKPESAVHQVLKVQPVVDAIGTVSNSSVSPSLSTHSSPNGGSTTREHVKSFQAAIRASLKTPFMTKMISQTHSKDETQGIPRMEMTGELESMEMGLISPGSPSYHRLQQQQQQSTQTQTQTHAQNHLLLDPSSQLLDLQGSRSSEQMEKESQKAKGSSNWTITAMKNAYALNHTDFGEDFESGDDKRQPVILSPLALTCGVVLLLSGILWCVGLGIGAFPAYLVLSIPFLAILLRWRVSRESLDLNRLIVSFFHGMTPFSVISCVVQFALISFTVYLTDSSVWFDILMVGKISITATVLASLIAPVSIFFEEYLKYRSLMVVKDQVDASIVLSSSVEESHEQGQGQGQGQEQGQGQGQEQGQEQELGQSSGIRDMMKAFISPNQSTSPMTKTKMKTKTSHEKPVEGIMAYLISCSVGFASGQAILKVFFGCALLVYSFQVSSFALENSGSSISNVITATTTASDVESVTSAVSAVSAVTSAVQPFLVPFSSSFIIMTSLVMAACCSLILCPLHVLTSYISVLGICLRDEFNVPKYSQLWRIVLYPVLIRTVCLVNVIFALGGVYGDITGRVALIFICAVPGFSILLALLIALDLESNFPQSFLAQVGAFSNGQGIFGNASVGTASEISRVPRFGSSFLSAFYQNENDGKNYTPNNAMDTIATKYSISPSGYIQQYPSHTSTTASASASASASAWATTTPSRQVQNPGHMSHFSQFRRFRHFPRHTPSLSSGTRNMTMIESPSQPELGTKNHHHHHHHHHHNNNNTKNRNNMNNNNNSDNDHDFDVEFDFEDPEDFESALLEEKYIEDNTEQTSIVVQSAFSNYTNKSPMIKDGKKTQSPNHGNRYQRHQHHTHSRQIFSGGSSFPFQHYNERLESLSTGGSFHPSRNAPSSFAYGHGSDKMTSRDDTTVQYLPRKANERFGKRPERLPSALTETEDYLGPAFEIDCIDIQDAFRYKPKTVRE